MRWQRTCARERSGSSCERKIPWLLLLLTAGPRAHAAPLLFAPLTLLLLRPRRYYEHIPLHPQFHDSESTYAKGNSSEVIFRYERLPPLAGGIPQTRLT